MIRKLLFLLLLLPFTSNATTTLTTGNFTRSALSDINLGYNSCIGNYASDPLLRCLWFADGDVLKFYHLGVDEILNITSTNDGWYLVKLLTIQPDSSGFETPVTGNAYNDDYFDYISAGWRIYYTSNPVADDGNTSDHRQRHAGFRTTKECSLTYDSNLYPDNLGGDLVGTTTTQSITVPSYSLVHSTGTYYPFVSYCTSPSPMGLSCQYNTVASEPFGSGPFNYLVIDLDMTSAHCEVEPLMSFPAREYLTGSQAVTTLFPLAPSEVTSSSLVPSLNSSGDLNTAEPRQVPSNFGFYNLTGNLPNSDTDGDGYDDDVDAFPTDPLEWLDTDGDGIGDNSDPDIDGDGVANGADYAPNDPLVTLDPITGGTGGGTTSGNLDGASGTGTDTTTQVDDPYATGAGDGASGSCGVEPVCSGSATDCAILTQTWLSACKIENALNPEDDDVITGGGNCDTPVTCTGDIIQCSILDNAWHDRCDTINDAVNFLTAGSAPTDIDTGFTIDSVTSSVDLNTLPAVGAFTGYSLQSGTCPASRVVALSMGAFDLPYTTFCELAESMAPLVLVFAYLVGSRNIYQAYVGS